MSTSSKQLERADFKELLGEPFTFSLEGVEKEIEGILTKVRGHTPANLPKNARPPFSLEFTFKPAANIGQCMFKVRTPKLNQLPPIFLVPSGEDADGWYMEASFN